MTVELDLTTEIAADVDAVFDLSLDVDAHVASTPGSRERAVAGVTSARLGSGDQVTWRAWHFGVPFWMTSRITSFERPHRFVDEQVRGPFTRFHHEHRFEPTPTGTRMHDRIRFDAPLGPLGDLVEGLLLERYLRELIETRNGILKQLAEAAA